MIFGDLGFDMDSDPYPGDVPASTNEDASASPTGPSSNISNLVPSEEESETILSTNPVSPVGYTFEELNGSSTPVIPVKRGRGRPRKYPLPDSQTSSPAPQVIATPRVQSVQSSTPMSLPMKRGPGRPRKNFDSEPSRSVPASYSTKTIASYAPSPYAKPPSKSMASTSNHRTPQSPYKLPRLHEQIPSKYNSPASSHDVELSQKPRATLISMITMQRETSFKQISEIADLKTTNQEQQGTIENLQKQLEEALFTIDAIESVAMKVSKPARRLPSTDDEVRVTKQTHHSLV